MKTISTVSTIIRTLTATVAFGALATLANAGPGLQYWKSLGKESQFKELKPGQSVTYVCMECKTLTDVEIKDQDQAMSYCKEGSTVTCPSCKMQKKVVRKTERNQAGSFTVVTYVNKDGKECAFFAKPSEKK
jgi:hypothetical protein